MKKMRPYLWIILKKTIRTKISLQDYLQEMKMKFWRLKFLNKLSLKLELSLLSVMVRLVLRLLPKILKAVEELILSFPDRRLWAYLDSVTFEISLMPLKSFKKML